MRRNQRIYKPLVLLLIALMLCSTIVIPTDIRPAQADSGNLADKAVAFLKSQYQADGAQGGYGIGPFDAYVLKSAGVDVSEWEYNDESMVDAVTDLADQDIDDDTASVKHLAQDLIAMQELGDSGRVDQLKALLQNRQNDDGSFQYDTSVYSIIPAYELLGRAGQLSVVDAVYAQDYILGQQDSSTGAWPDFMVTAQAVRALNYLSPGAAPDSAVGQAITSGCSWLKQQQQSDGSFQAALDDPLIDTAEAIATQKALDLDPAADWTTGGRSAVDYLNDSSLNDDGSFGSSRNVMDATWALDSFVLLGILPTGGGGGGGDDPSADVSVRVRVEGITSTPVDATVSVSGSALDALEQAVGSGNVVAPGGFITSINGESGSSAGSPPTSWFYYVIRGGEIDQTSLSSVPSGYTISDGDQAVFYIGAYDASTYENLTFLPVVSITPQAPMAGQDITFSISAQKYDWSAGLQELSEAEAAAIGDYTVTIGGETYTSSDGQVTVPDAAEGDLSYTVTNQSTADYPDVVPYRGNISVGLVENASVRVRVEGITSAPVDATVSVSGTALDALEQAVGSGNVVAPGGFITSINGESGSSAGSPPTSWFYYVIRGGEIDQTSLSSVPGGYNISDGDQVVFYIGAYDASTYENLTYLPVVSVSPQAPTAGQTVTLGISAQKYDWTTGLQDLSSAEAAAIGDYTVTIGGETYTSSYGQVVIPDVTAGDLSYVVTNQNAAGYPNVVPYRGSVSVGAAASSSVRVRVEGITSTPVDATVSVPGTALDALNQAVGSGNVVAPGGFITSINGESGSSAGSPPTSWFYYVIRGGEIDQTSLSSVPGGYNISDGDQVVFYIGAYDASTYENLTYLPVVSVSPQAPTAGQTVTLSISAKKYDWTTGLQDLSSAEAAAIGDYTVTAGGETYTSSYGQVVIPDVTAGDLSYAVTNQNAAGYPNVVPYRGSVSVGTAASSSVRVRVEGITSTPVDATVSVPGTALDALNQAVGSANVVAPGGFITSINGEGGNPAADPPTSWFYYAIRNGYIDPVSLSSAPSGYNISDGDQVVFYIGAYDASTYENLTYLPVVSVSPQAPTAGQTVTLSISAKKYDWTTGLQELSEAEAAAIGDYTVKIGTISYTSSYGQLVIHDIAEGDLSYTVTNQNTAGYPNVVPYRGSVSVGTAVSSSVQVRVEGITGTPVDATVSVSGTALDALEQAVGSGNVVAPGGFITSINGEGGNPAADPPTSWFYYAIRNGYIDPVSLSSAPSGYNVSDGDQVVFYIGAYDASTYENLTFLPVVSITPQAPTAGQDITFSISAQKYDWSAGLQELSETESAAVGDYTVTVGGTTYTSSGGQVTVPDAAEGDLSYVITNQSTAGYPDVVPYRGSISVGPANSGGGSITTRTPGIAVVGMSGEILFGPSTVTVFSTNPWGMTAMGALDATGLSYAMSSTWDGYVDSIDGQASSGTKGWMYTVNGTAPMVLAKDYTISSGDKVIWYYSNSMDQEAPTWDQLNSGEQSTTTSSSAVTSTTGKATVVPSAGGTIGLGSEASIIIPADALSGSAGVEVAIQKVSSPPSAPDGFRLFGSVFEFTVGGSTSYKFKKPVTLSFIFDVSALPEGEKPSVYYYDTASSKWVDLGGAIDGSIITVNVDHLTRFALMIKDVKPATAPAQSFTDVPASFWASEAIINLNRLGYVNGYLDGTFKPDNQITRSEFVSILDKALKLPSYSPAVPDFSDVSSKDWFFSSVENAVHAGIIKGYGGTFNPNQQVTREELAVIMVNALGKYEEAGASMNEKTGFSDDADISDWARGFVAVAVKNGLIKGYPNGGFNPRDSATRAEACVIITNLLNLKESMK